MDNLAARVAVHDPEAGSALRVVSHFDALVESAAGLQSLVRATAALAGCPARLVVPERRLLLRVLADGTAVEALEPPRPEWPSSAVSPGGALLWLERPGPVGAAHAVVMERAVAAMRVSLERAGGVAVHAHGAPWEVLLDASRPAEDRRLVGRRLALPSQVRAVALPRGGSRVISAEDELEAPLRAGVGPATPVEELPRSWAMARMALRLSAEGTQADPGPRVVHADRMGGLSLLVAAADQQPAPHPDASALELASRAAPTVLQTLDAIARSTSLREAARVLFVHHSTLQDRLAAAEAALGWTVTSPEGRLRLQLAFALWRARRPTA